MSLWSEPKPGTTRFAVTYVAVALLALLELMIAWQAIHPNVPADYRAYFIDHTTTCLAQAVTGTYTLGATIDFRSGGADTRELRPCGWEGPAGDGMHAVGESAQLRFATGPVTTPLTLTLQLTAVTLPNAPEQHIDISANGSPIGSTSLAPGATSRSSFNIPAGAITGTGLLDITLDFPNAINARAGDANTRKRSIKLTEATVSARP